MEQNELNLCELLKDCEGEKFYSLVIGECVLTEITHPDSSDTYPIRLSHSHYTSDGRFELSGAQVVYPSRALYEKYPLDAYSAWMEWKESREPKRWTPQIGERIFWVNANLTVSQDVYNDFETQRKRRAVGNEFQTGKLAQQVAEGIREYLQNFHELKEGER